MTHDRGYAIKAEDAGFSISTLLTIPEERDEYDNYMAFNALKESLSGSIPGHANWPMATEGQITELQRIAEACTGRSSVMARGVLSQTLTLHSIATDRNS